MSKTESNNIVQHLIFYFLSCFTKKNVQLVTPKQNKNNRTPVVSKYTQLHNIITRAVV